MIFSRPVHQDEELGYNLYHSTFASTIDEEFCNGCTRSIRIRDGITVLHAELTFYRDSEVKMISTQPQVGFCFCTKGTMSIVQDLLIVGPDLISPSFTYYDLNPA
jgi:hypothetical protein